MKAPTRMMTPLFGHLMTKTNFCRFQSEAATKLKRSKSVLIDMSCIHIRNHSENFSRQHCYYIAFA